MHNIEPFSRWLIHYDSSDDEASPFYGKEYNYDLFTEAIYNYYIDPAWDFFGSETLYLKVLFADYEQGAAIFEFIGEWNDAINNDIMHLKRNIIEQFMLNGIQKFIMIGENVYNFHGSDDSYYEEWFEELEGGWISTIGFRDFILEEWKKYSLDYYFNFGGDLEIHNWRTFTPLRLIEKVDTIISRRIDLT